MASDILDQNYVDMAIKFGERKSLAQDLDILGQLNLELDEVSWSHQKCAFFKTSKHFNLQKNSNSVSYLIGFGM